MTNANCRYGHFTNRVFRSKTDKCKQLFPVARFGTVGRSGGLQADSLGSLGGRTPRKGEVFARECSYMATCLLCMAGFGIEMAKSQVGHRVNIP